MTVGAKLIGQPPESILLSGQSGKRKTWNGTDGKFETFQGTVRPKWNQYSLTDIRAGCNQDRYLGSWTEPGSGPLPNPIDIAVIQGEPGDLVTWTSNDDLALLSKLTEKVRGHSFNLAVATGEAKKTVNTVVDALFTLSRSFSALRRGDFATAARRLGVQPRGHRTKALETKDIASRWLELQYGWRPLIGDVFDAFSAYHALTSEARSNTVTTKLGKSQSKVVNVGPYQYAIAHTRSKHLTFEMTEMLSAPRQLGLEDPASVIWELLPYSFVVDWFYPIGSYLDNLNQIPKLVGRFMTSTTNLKTEGEYVWAPWPSWPFPLNSTARPSVKITQQAGYYFRKLVVDRVPSSSLNVPLPSFDSSGLRGNRVYNAIALAKIAFG